MFEIGKLLIENFLQVLVAFLWISGLNRFSGKLRPALHADLLGYALLFPPLLAVARVFGLPSIPDEFRLARIHSWAEYLFFSGERFAVAGAVLSLGTAALFVSQELIPVIKLKLPYSPELRRYDQRLNEIFQEVVNDFRKKKFDKWRAHPVRVYVIETTDPVAALQGLVDPVLLVSRNLMERLDEDELRAVLAHEYAHYIYGGNFQMLWIWVARAIQVLNPMALIVFRSLTELREHSCDALAAHVTEKSGALASALMKVYSQGRGMEQSAAGLMAQARMELEKRAENLQIKKRIRRLLDESPEQDESRTIRLIGIVLMGVILWAIG